MSIALSDYVVDLKTSLHNILKSFFDNASHEISDYNIVFPSAKLVYTIQEIASPQGLTIAFIGFTETGRSEEKCDNRLLDGKPGIELRVDLLSTVFIATPIQGGDNSKNRMIVDQAWSKLYAVFTQYSLFSAQGIFLPSLQAIPDPSVNRTDLAEVSGTFSCQARMKYARYSL